MRNHTQKFTLTRIVAGGAMAIIATTGASTSTQAAEHPAICLPLVSCDEPPPGDDVDGEVDLDVDLDLDLDLDEPKDEPDGPIVDGPGDTDVAADTDVDLHHPTTAVVDTEVDVVHRDTSAAAQSNTKATVDLHEPSVEVTPNATADADIDLGRVVDTHVESDVCGVQIVVNTSSSATCHAPSSSVGFGDDALVDLDGVVNVCGVHVAVLGDASTSCQEPSILDGADDGELAVDVIADVCGVNIAVLGDSSTECSGGSSAHHIGDGVLDAFIDLCGLNVGIFGDADTNCGRTAAADQCSISTLCVDVDLCGLDIAVLGDADGECDDAGDQTDDQSHDPAEDPGDDDPISTPDTEDPRAFFSTPGGSVAGETADRDLVDTALGTSGLSDDDETPSSSRLPSTGISILLTLLAGTSVLAAGAGIRRAGLRRADSAI